jgi:hypothetical protein
MIRRAAWSADRGHQGVLRSRSLADTEEQANVFDHDKTNENLLDASSVIESDPVTPNFFSQAVSSDDAFVIVLLVVISTILALLVVAVCVAVYYYRPRPLLLSSSTKEGEDTLQVSIVVDGQNLPYPDGQDEGKNDQYDYNGVSNATDDETQATSDSKRSKEATSISSVLAVIEDAQTRATPYLTTVVDSTTEQDDSSSMPSTTPSRNIIQAKHSRSGPTRFTKSKQQSDSIENDDSLIFSCDVSPFDFLYQFHYNDDQSVGTATTTSTYYHDDRLVSFYRNCGSRQPAGFRRSTVSAYSVNDDTTYHDDTTYTDDTTTYNDDTTCGDTPCNDESTYDTRSSQWINKAGKRRHRDSSMTDCSADNEDESRHDYTATLRI